MPKPPTPNGTAEIQAQGQTASDVFGSNPDAKGPYDGSKKPRDLKLGK